MTATDIIKRLLVILAMLTLASCSAMANGAASAPPAGQVWGVSLQSTLEGIGQCLRQEAGTAIIEKGNSVIFAFRIGQGWGFSGFNVGKEVLYDGIQKANMTNYNDGSQIMQSWIQDDWSYVDPRNLPASVLDAIAVGFARVASQLTTVAVFPVGTVDPGRYGVIPNNPVNQ